MTEHRSFPEAEHATISNLHLTSTALQALGYPALDEPYTPAHYPLFFQSTPAEQAAISLRLEQAEINEEKPLVVIHPGTGGAVKLWRIDGWSTIANRLASGEVFGQQAQIVLTGSPKELPLLQEIARNITPTPVLFTDLTVGQLAALLARAQLVLGVDNGPLHMAAAQDTPSLRLYGPTDTHIFGPWGDPARQHMLISTQKCASCPLIPCGRLDFTEDELPAHPCVRLITDLQVEQAIRALINTQLQTSK